MMLLPKYYNKRLKFGLPCLLVLVSLVYLLHIIWLKPINQDILEVKAIDMHMKNVFNPKFSTNHIYKYLVEYFDSPKDEFGVFFHWDDYVDSSVADSVLAKLKVDNSECSCDENMINFGNVDSYWMESYHTKVLRSMTNLFCSKSIPDQIFVPSNSNYIKVPVLGKKRYGSLLNTSVSLDNYEILDDVLPKSLQGPGISPDESQVYSVKPYNKSIDMDVNEFYFDVEYEIFQLNQLKSSGVITASESKRLDFLKQANEMVDDVDRYFKYPWIYSDVVQGNSHHLSYPFFKRYIPIRERQSIIQHIIRAWFEFAEAIEVPSWVNYGSLLGWAYNGVNMPWDTDVDVQLSIRHLDYLARYYNNSLIIENPKLGNGKYLLDISPSYVRQGNSRNFIDGRFIDVNSGLYIDISAVSHTSFKPPSELKHYEDDNDVLVHCKHFNWHALSEILPLRHTYFEGSSIYIPSNISSILTRKYGRESFTTKSNFMNYNYQSDINLWVSDDICSSSPAINRFETDKDGKEDKSELTLAGACNSQVLKDEYKISYEFSQRHSMIDEDIDHPISYKIEDFQEMSLTRKDTWDYYDDIRLRKVKDGNWYHEYSKN